MPRRPRARQDDFIFVPPSEIRFTQSSIAPMFKNGLTLTETALELMTGNKEKREVTMMTVVLHSDGFYYSLDNRRLAVFRLLEMVGVVRSIKARSLPDTCLDNCSKYDTTTEGREVKVRGPEGYMIGDSASTTTFPLHPFKHKSSCLDWSLAVALGPGDKRLLAPGVSHPWGVDPSTVQRR
eukprot:TRINITY_DN60578_c0_g1_i1.p1 TRINITY_DN60578_c0_g1~~TRINITY_DN60578_c0_g1_i1.p1  ORF type:complete len:181 (+),score=21.01 TRINITY_DN60578_c0_g1_i1:57-599(+)